GPQQRGSPARASTALSPGFAACESSRITPETAACEAAGDQETKSPGDVFVCCSCSLDLLASCCARSREHPYATKPSPARNNGVHPARASTALSPGFAACESSRITPETAACGAAGDQETKSPGDVFVCCSCSLDLLACCCARSREHPYATKPSPARNNGVHPRAHRQHCPRASLRVNRVESRRRLRRAKPQEIRRPRVQETFLFVAPALLISWPPVAPGLASTRMRRSHRRPATTGLTRARIDSTVPGIRCV